MGRSRKSPDQIRRVRQFAALAKHHGPEVAADLVARSEAQRPAQTAAPTTLATIEDYDALLGQPQTWDDAKRREGVQAELIANEIRRNDLAKSRGQLFTAEQVREQRQREDEAIFDELGQLPEAVVTLFPPEAKAGAAKLVRGVISDFRSRVQRRFEALR